MTLDDDSIATAMVGLRVTLELNAERYPTIIIDADDAVETAFYVMAAVWTQTRYDLSYEEALDMVERVASNIRRDAGIAVQAVLMSVIAAIKKKQEHPVHGGLPPRRDPSCMN